MKGPRSVPVKQKLDLFSYKCLCAFVLQDFSKFFRYTFSGLLITNDALKITNCL